jgi:hypothetical protein
MVESGCVHDARSGLLATQPYRRVVDPSPMMDTNQYRLEFAAYHTKSEIAHYEYRAGLVPELLVRPIYERYGNLFSREAVEDLRRAESEVPTHLDSEISGMRALIGAACIGYLDLQSRELTNELARRESSAKIVWDGEELSSFGVPKSLANESSSKQRRDLYARWLDCVAENDDLRVARFEALHQSSRELGFDSYRALYTKAIGSDFGRLADRARALLDRTEKSFRNALARKVVRDLPDIDQHDLQHADFYFFQRVLHLDQFFPARDVMTTYEKTMKGLGINVGSQKNIHIDDVSRPSKHPRAACLRIDPPDDVRLLVSPIGGATDYMTLFHEAGHAQHFGWTSRDLVSRHPEFVYSPDNATTESFAFLFNHLFHDAGWLREHRPGLSEEQARMIAYELAMLSMHSVRRYCAKLLYDIALHDSSSVRSEELAATYASLQTEATGFARGPAHYLSDVDDGYYSAAYLRAWAFEAGLREYLRTRYGYRWWASSKAGDELIDLWSTSSRYSVEELSSLLGMGELDFDLLAETYISAMNEE